MKGKDEEGLIGFLNLLKENGTDAKDVGKALNLAGLNKDLAQTIIKNSELADVADTVVSGFDAMATASSGIGGKLSTLNKGAVKLATTLGEKLKSGFSTLWSTVKSHPLISAAAGVYAGYKFVKWQQEQAFESAQNDADTWQSKDNTLQTKISNFQQLREQLDSGVLSAQEEYNIRSQILDLQKEISNTYSGQSSGINLVNGDLQTQLDILNKISAAKAQDFLDDNKDGWINHPIKDAKKAMEEENTYDIANHIGKNTDRERLLKASINRVNDQLSLRDIAKELGIIEDFSADSIKDFIEALGDAGIITASDHIDTTALSAEQLATKVEAAQTALSNISSVISASNSDSGLLTDNITALEESFGGLDSYNTESLLSNTADGVKLNTTALKGLIVQQHKADSDDLEARIKGQNEELQKQKDILNDVTQSEDNKQNAKEQIDSITDAIERMKQAQSQLYASYKQQMELTSDYQAVLDAENTPNAGARYDNMKSKVKTAKEAFDKGEIGTDDFKTVARYLSPNGFEDPENFAENYQKAKRYLTDDSSGVINFLQDLQSKGLATMTTLADGTHEWTTSFDDAAEASKQAGIHLHKIFFHFQTDLQIHFQQTLASFYCSYKQDTLFYIHHNILLILISNLSP